MHHILSFRNRDYALGLAGILAAIALASGACVVQDDATGSSDSFEEFASSVYQEPESGLYIVDGDTPVQDIDELRAFYDRYVRPGALIVHQVDEVDAVWDDAHKSALTYCVSKKGFDGDYDMVVQAMDSATSAWEAVADVDFIHVREQDDDCDKRNGDVVFDVRPTSGGQYLARAFFPDSDRRYRNILIDQTSFSTEPPLTLTGILRHELGHALGFRHEHTRAESGVCFEDSSWRALTEYDSDSVMHYPQCNGTGDWSLVLTDKDEQGAASLYGAPGNSADTETADNV